MTDKGGHKYLLNYRKAPCFSSEQPQLLNPSCSSVRGHWPSEALWRFGGVGTHRMLFKGPAVLTVPQMKAVTNLTVSVVLMSALPSPCICSVQTLGFS